MFVFLQKGIFFPEIVLKEKKERSGTKKVGNSGDHVITVAVYGPTRALIFLGYFITIL